MSVWTIVSLGVYSRSIDIERVEPSLNGSKGEVLKYDLVNPWDVPSIRAATDTITGVNPTINDIDSRSKSPIIIIEIALQFLKRSVRRPGNYF